MKTQKQEPPELQLASTDELLTVEQAASFLKVPKNFIYEKSVGENPEIIGIRCGKYKRIPRSSLLQFLKRQNPNYVSVT